MIAELPSGSHVGSSLVQTGAVLEHGADAARRRHDPRRQDAYRRAKPRIGDIVAFHPPAGAVRERRCGRRPPAGQACATATRRNSARNFIKRIVGRPGDRVSIRHGHVIRDGERAREDFITPCAAGEDCDFPRTFTVAANRYYLLGDNRGSSDDSRYWGPVAAKSIVGRVQRLGP